MLDLARTPSETVTLFVEKFNQGNVDRLIAAYYAPGAILAASPGVSTTGAELRTALGRYFEAGGAMVASVRHCLQSGDTALLVIDWAIRGSGQDGTPLEVTGTSTDVVRLQADGGWRCIIDNPHGTT